MERRDLDQSFTIESEESKPILPGLFTWKFTKRQALYGRYHANFAAFRMAVQETIDQLSGSHKPRLESLMTLKFQEFKNVPLIAA